jgi:retron-type reverse transcriptase
VRTYRAPRSARSLPSRPHDALDALWVGISRKKVNWILDADIRSFFDEVRHDWLLKFVEHRIADRRILRLIRKWLRAGVSEEGKRKWSKTEKGTPQGAVASPLLANVYLHYAFDLWVQHGRRHDSIAVRWSKDPFPVIDSVSPGYFLDRNHLVRGQRVQVNSP